jgi:glycosyltransferase involved in cell wall biosynthesis
MHALPPYDVVIPCFNRAHAVGDAIASVLAQSHRAKAIVVVDDHSSDRSHAVALEAAMADDTIHAIRHSTNQGASASRNTGATLCASPWIAFLDSDDVWLPDAARDLIGRGIEDDLDVVVGMFARVEGDDVPGNPECGWTQDTIRDGLRAGGVVGPSWTVMRREVFDRVGGFDTSFHNCNDWDFFTRVGASGAAFGRSGTLVAHYRTVAGPRLVGDEAALTMNGQRVLQHPWLA